MDERQPQSYYWNDGQSLDAIHHQYDGADPELLQGFDSSFPVASTYSLPTSSSQGGLPNTADLTTPGDAVPTAGAELEADGDESVHSDGEGGSGRGRQSSLSERVAKGMATPERRRELNRMAQKRLRHRKDAYFEELKTRLQESEHEVARLEGDNRLLRAQNARLAAYTTTVNGASLPHPQADPTSRLGNGSVDISDESSSTTSGSSQSTTPYWSNQAMMNFNYTSGAPSSSHSTLHPSPAEHTRDPATLPRPHTGMAGPAYLGEWPKPLVSSRLSFEGSDKR